MKRQFSILLCFSFIFLFCSCFHTPKQETIKKEYKLENAEQVLPKAKGWVNDFAFVFTKKERQELDAILQNYSDESTNQIVIITIKHIHPYSNIKDYSTDLGNYWGIGLAEKNNGVLIVLNKEDRQIRISTGTKVENILTDELVKSIIDSTIIPPFKEEKFFEGIQMGINELIKNWN